MTEIETPRLEIWETLSPECDSEPKAEDRGGPQGLETSEIVETVSPQLLTAEKDT